MKFTGTSFKTKSGINLALSNEFEDLNQVTDAIEDAKDAQDLCNKLSHTKNYLKSITVDRETDEYIRLKCVAHMCDNISMLTVFKAKEPEPVAKGPSIKVVVADGRVEKVLIEGKVYSSVEIIDFDDNFDDEGEQEKLGDYLEKLEKSGDYTVVTC